MWNFAHFLGVRTDRILGIFWHSCQNLLAGLISPKRILYAETIVTVVVWLHKLLKVYKILPKHFPKFLLNYIPLDNMHAVVYVLAGMCVCV
jgi:hypothetical protein